MDTILEINLTFYLFKNLPDQLFTKFQALHLKKEKTL